MTVHLPPRPASAPGGLRRAGRLWVGVLVLGLLGLLAACSSSSSSSTSPAALYGTALQQQCTTVSDMLSDGPDPDADPVGYAQAQIMPLRQLKLSDTALQSAVTALASAYQVYSSSTGAASKSAAAQATKDAAAVNAICPGAAN